jgi:branched-chain amino acid aminotransferase
LYTAPLDNIFPGITRQTVIELARQMGVEVIEEEFGPDAVLDMDAAFFTGTAVEIAGIASINGHKLKLEWEDSIGYLLHNRYKKIVSGNDTNFLEYF